MKKLSKNGEGLDAWRSEGELSSTSLFLNNFFKHFLPISDTISIHNTVQVNY